MDQYQTKLFNLRVCDEGIHRHRIPISSDEPHTYQMVTRAAEARADQGLDSQIVIDINKSTS